MLKIGKTNIRTHEANNREQVIFCIFYIARSARVIENISDRSVSCCKIGWAQLVPSKAFLEIIRLISKGCSFFITQLLSIMFPVYHKFLYRKPFSEDSTAVAWKPFMNAVHRFFNRMISIAYFLGVYFLPVSLESRIICCR